MDAIYNVTMLAVDIAVLGALAKSRIPARGWFASAIIGATALLMGLMAGGMFSAMRLLAYGAFLHVPLALVVAGAWAARAGQRRTSLLAWGIAVLLVAIAIDAFWCEPRWLEQTHFRLASSKIDRPLRIVLVADLQTDHVSAYERGAIERALKCEPDLLLFAGDYLQLDDANQWDTECAALGKILREFSPPISCGVYAVAGNVDSPRWPEIFDTNNAHACTSTQTFQHRDIAVTCLALQDSFNTRLALPADKRFHIVLGHSPDYAMGNVQADLLLAGHVHGGQVRLPWFGPLITLSQLPRAWTVGRTDLPGNRTLVVSRGIGLERGTAPRMRFFCRPEIVVVDIEPLQPRTPR